MSAPRGSTIADGVKAAARIMIIALLITSWLAISNHCAFVAIAATAPAPQNDCPFHSKPAKPQPARAGVECCKVLRALSPAAKTAVRAIVDLPHVDRAFARGVLMEPAKIYYAVSALDTGPPPAATFAETILQRSILAHAPPVGA